MFFGAFLGPILAVLLFNVVIFIWVIVILVRHTRGQIKRSKEKMKPKTVVRLLISISGIMFLFGLTWLFAAFTFQIGTSTVLRDAFQALFTIFASFQGFFIFLFFCVFNREARESWKETLSCGRYKSELLHPSQYKNTSSAGTGTRTRKANTGTTGSFTSTSYNSATLEKARYEAQSSPAHAKKDLSKNDNGVDSFPLTSRGEIDNEGVSTFKDEPDSNKDEPDSNKDEPDSNKDDDRYVDLPLTSVNEQSIEEGATPFTIVAESGVDEGEERKAPNWSEAEPVPKARIKRFSTKKASKHHVEEYQLDFENGDSDEDDTTQA